MDSTERIAASIDHLTMEMHDLVDVLYFHFGVRRHDANGNPVAWPGEIEPNHLQSARQQDRDR